MLSCHLNNTLRSEGTTTSNAWKSHRTTGTINISRLEAVVDHRSHFVSYGVSLPKRDAHGTILTKLKQLT